MSKSYKTYLKKIINEAEIDYGKDMSNLGTTEVDPKVKAHVKPIIDTIVGSLPKPLQSLFKNPDELDALVNFGAKIVKGLEYGNQDTPVNPVSGERGVLSSNYETIKSNPLIASLYLAIAQIGSGIDIGAPITLPFKIIKDIGDPVSELSNMTDEELNDALLLVPRGVVDPSQLNSAFRSLFNAPIDNKDQFMGKSFSGMNIKDELPKDKGFGRSNALVRSLLDIGIKHFGMNANTYGQNIGGVKETNEIVNDFINKMISKESMEKGNKEVGVNAINDLKANFNNELERLADKFVAVNKYNKREVFVTMATNIMKKLSSGIKDPEAIKNLVTSEIDKYKDFQYKAPDGKIYKANVFTKKYLDALFGDLLKSLHSRRLAGGDHKEIVAKTPLPEKTMMDVLRALFSVDADLMSVTGKTKDARGKGLNDFIYHNYDENSPVLQLYTELMRKSTRDSGDKEVPDDETLAKELSSYNIPSPAPKDAPKRPTKLGHNQKSDEKSLEDLIKSGNAKVKESFYDSMLSYINEK